MMKKALAILFAAAFAVTGAVSTPVQAADVDLDGTYNAYLGLQTPKYSFRNSWNEPNYGLGVTGDDGMVYFNQVTGWDGSTAVTLPGTFTDAVIAGNGTYSVSVDGLDFSKFDDFSDQDFLNLLFVDTDIPNTGAITISNVHCIFDGADKYTFDEAFLDPDAKDYIDVLCCNLWNDDLAKGQLFYYSVPMKKIEVTFDVSGFNYDYGSAPAASTTDTASTDTLPKTGTLPVAMYVAIGSAVVIGGAVVATKKKRA
jgi:LPXTG-motif cell wall-anchored protein